MKKLEILVIKSNDKLENLNFSDQKNHTYENLRKLVIKNNNNLAELNHLISNSQIELSKLKTIKIENNKSLKTLQFSKQKSYSWLENFSRHFNPNPSLAIKNNNCLGSLKLNNLKNLRELRIEGNDNLKEIDFGSLELSQGKKSTEPNEKWVNVGVEQQQSEEAQVPQDSSTTPDGPGQISQALPNPSPEQATGPP